MIPFYEVILIHNNRIYSLSSHISPIIFRSLCFLSESQSFSKSLILLSISSLFLFGLKVYSPSRKQSPATEIMFSSMTHKFPFERAAMAEKMIKRAKARRNRHIREIMDNREEKLAKRIREAYRVWRSPICQWLRRIDSMGDLMIRLQERVARYGMDCMEPVEQEQMIEALAEPLRGSMTPSQAEQVREIIDRICRQARKDAFLQGARCMEELVTGAEVEIPLKMGGIWS